MPHNRFFVDSPFDEKISLIDREANHAKVMRLKPDDTIELVNGRNQLAYARILTIRKDRIDLQIESTEERPPPFPIILCQAIPRASKLDWIVEKGTELGMTQLWLFPSERSEKKAVNLQRARLIAIAAMKQCGRLDLPSIEEKPPLGRWQRLEFPAFFGDTSHNAPPFKALWKKEKGACFFIGPESGFTEQEVQMLINLGALGVKLHPNILRTETASLVALSLMQS